MYSDDATNQNQSNLNADKTQCNIIWALKNLGYVSWYASDIQYHFELQSVTDTRGDTFLKNFINFAGKVTSMSSGI